MKKTITKKHLQALKLKATKQLFYGIAMAIVATIPVILHIGTDVTGSVFCWIMSAIVIFDSIKRLYVLNTKY